MKNFGQCLRFSPVRLSLVLLTLATAAHSAVFTVTSTNDPGPGSLRQAILDAQTNAGADIITFDAALNGATITITNDPFFTYFTLYIDDTNGLTIDAMNLPDGLVVNGGSQPFSLMYVESGTTLALRGLTLANGGRMSASMNGGAINNRGTTTVAHCTFSNNAAYFSGYGGAIANFGALSITSSTFVSNRAGSASAIYNSSGGATMTLTHCTVSGNSASSDAAIYSGGVAALRHCTVVGNNSQWGVRNNGSLVLENSIVAANPGFQGNPRDILNYGTLTPVGTNIVQTLLNVGGITNGSGTIIEADPLLGPLADNGGRTRTISLRAGSPALDAASVIAGLNLDQRGLPRHRDGDGNGVAVPDIGAFEAQAVPFGMGFSFNDGPPNVYYPLESTNVAGALGFRQSNWNNFTNRSGSAPVASSSTGVPVPLRFWWEAWFVSAYGNTPGTPDQKLMFGRLHGDGQPNAGTNLFESQNQPFVALAELPAAATLGGYKVLAYADGYLNDTNADVGEFWLTTHRGENPANVSDEIDLSPHLFLKDFSDFSGLYMRVPATATNLASAAPGNYLVFEGQTEPGFILRTDGSFYTEVINAVQIIRNEIVVVTTLADELDAVDVPGSGVSLREALRDAPDGGGIVFDPVVFNGTNNTILLSTTLGEIPIRKNVVVDASGIPGGVTVRGGDLFRRLFYVAPGRNVSLLGLTLTFGGGVGAVFNDFGGAILNDGALTLSRCTLSSNRTHYGGGAIFSRGCALMLMDCTLIGNLSAGHHGGAIYNERGAATLNRCRFFNNRAPFASGGAICHVNDTMTLVLCSLATNQASASGAIFGLAPMSLTQCSLWNNAGGAIYNGDTQVLTHCTIALNQGYDGSALRCGVESLTSLQHCTVFGNSLDGAIYASGKLNLENTIVGGSTNSTGGAITDIHNSGGTVLRIGANIVQSSINTSFGTTSGPAAITNAPLLAPLHNYGGPTPTMALLPGSPARDAAVGSNATSDQRGFSLVGLPDLGAYEAGAARDYFTWTVETFPINATPEERAANYDYDGDGYLNAAEYGALSDPTATNTALALVFTPNVEGTIGTNTFAVRTDATDLLYQLARGTTVTNLTAIVELNPGTRATNTFGPGVTLHSSGNNLTVTDTNLSGRAHLFYKLDVQLTP